jgi:hypothetical protein
MHHSSKEEWITLIYYILRNQSHKDQYYYKTNLGKVCISIECIVLDIQTYGSHMLGITKLAPVIPITQPTLGRL